MRRDQTADPPGTPCQGLRRPWRCRRCRRVVYGQTAPGPATDAEILALINKHCVQCHAAQPTHEAFAKAPKGVVLETIEEISRHAPTIMNQVVIERAMPLGNQTGMTDAERDLLAPWIEGRK